ncbi:hypothetical protein BDQ17DRAFT_1427437 [Cyathus striatus]|nr:hypothetical protein BDQ17DRAFT_1427437 [Cyathus striatus]
MAQPTLPEAIPKATLESFIGQLIIHAFLSGLYTFILYRTVCGAVSRIRNGRHIILIATLISLYVLNMINFAASWVVTISVLIINKLNESKILLVGNNTGIVATLIADALLAWRCYILWLKNKWLLAAFGVLLLGESALMTTVFVKTTKYDFFPCFLIISLVITVLATSMIIYRIVTISREAGTTRRYRYIIEILVESGFIYSTSLLVIVVCFFLRDVTPSAREASFYASSVLIPVSGIAPTLIAERVVNSTEHDEERWSQPISTLRFNHTTQRGLETHQESHIVNPSAPSPC